MRVFGDFFGECFLGVFWGGFFGVESLREGNRIGIRVKRILNIEII